MSDIYIIEAIISLIFGICLASYTSSVFYRLPRSIPLNGFNNPKYKPFCSSCKHPLKFYEYYSVLSWFFCGTKCNYCDNFIDSKFRITETIVIFNSIYLHYLFGFSDNYLLFLLWSVALTIITAITFTAFEVPTILFLIIAALGTMIKLDNGQALMDWLFNAVSFTGILLLFSKARLKLNYINMTHIYTLISSSFIKAEYFIYIVLLYILTTLILSAGSKVKKDNITSSRLLQLGVVLFVYINFIIEIKYN